MSPSRVSLILPALLWTVPLTVAQNGDALAPRVRTETAQGVDGIGPSRLAAGVREYPARVLRALLLLAEQPLVLRQLADEPELLDTPDAITPPVSADVQAAIGVLREMPAIVAVAASRPHEMQALRRMYAEAPEGMEQRLLQLRAGYEAAWLRRAASWQTSLESDPVALGEYRALLTRFCEQERQAYEDFPYVRVRERAYYFACPPNEAIVAFAQQQSDTPSARRLIERWWTDYASERVDALVLEERRQRQADVAPRTGALAALPPEARRTMWQPADAGDAGTLGLVPVIMQPPADQPAAARYAYAVAEHARLWSPPEPAELPTEGQPEPPVALQEPPPTIGEELAREREIQRRLAEAERRDADRRYGDGSYYGRKVDDDYPYNDVDDYDDGYYRTRYDRRTWYGTYCRPVWSYYCGYPLSWPLFQCGPVTLVYPEGHAGCPSANRTYGYVYPGSGVGAGPGYISAVEQLTLGQRYYPTYGGRVSGAARVSPNTLCGSSDRLRSLLEGHRRGVRVLRTPAESRTPRTPSTIVPQRPTRERRADCGTSPGSDGRRLTPGRRSGDTADRGPRPRGPGAAFRGPSGTSPTRNATPRQNSDTRRGPSRGVSGARDRGPAPSGTPARIGSAGRGTRSTGMRPAPARPSVGRPSASSEARVLSRGGVAFQRNANGRPVQVRPDSTTSGRR